jgi:hypothetical protein
MLALKILFKTSDSASFWYIAYARQIAQVVFGVLMTPDSVGVLGSSGILRIVLKTFSGARGQIPVFLNAFQMCSSVNDSAQASLNT